MSEIVWETEGERDRKQLEGEQAEKHYQAQQRASEGGLADRIKKGMADTGFAENVETGNRTLSSEFDQDIMKRHRLESIPVAERKRQRMLERMQEGEAGLAPVQEEKPAEEPSKSSVDLQSMSKAELDSLVDAVFTEEDRRKGL